jgi:hypothetical protein
MIPVSGALFFFEGRVTLRFFVGNKRRLGISAILYCTIFLMDSKIIVDE